MMTIKHETKGKKGTFFIEEGGKRLGELAYFSSAPGKMNIYHTEVDSEFRGENLGEDLVATAVAYAREKDLKVIPTCPFVKKVFDETPEYQDLLAGE